MLSLNSTYHKVSLPIRWWLAIGLVLVLGILLWRMPLFTQYQVVQQSPSDQARDVPITVNLLVEFNRPLPSDPPPLVKLTPPVPGQVSLQQNNHQLVFIPKQLLQHETEYQVSITAPGLEHHFSFRTAPAQPLPFASPLTPQPTNFPNVTPPTPSSATLQQLSDLIKSLPVTTQAYRIEYNPVANRIFIILYQAPVEQSKTRALNYLKGFGFEDPEQQLLLDIITSPALSRQLNSPTPTP